MIVMTQGERRAALVLAASLVLAILVNAWLQRRPPMVLSQAYEVTQERWMEVLDADGTLDINSADAETLQRLPGIGPVLSQRIVEYRDRHGPYRTYGDLTAVEGIGPKLLERIQEHAKID